MTEPKQYRAPAIERAARAIEYLAESGRERSLSDIARFLGVGKSSALGVLRALEDVGWVERLEEGYRVGGRLNALCGSREFGVLARPHMEELANRFGHSVCLGRVRGSRVLIEECVEGPAPLHISLRPGSSLPLLAAATGKALLSQKSSIEAERLIDSTGLPAYTPRSIALRERFLEEVALAGRRGWATDEEEYLRGVNAVAVPVREPGGAMALLWIVGLADSLSPEVFPAVGLGLVQAAHKIAGG